MNYTSKFHIVSEIGQGIYRIEESGVSCFLVLGESSALLIDTCNGIGNIREVVESITSLPIDVVATHGHTDHIGGCYWFPEIYVHTDDISITTKITGSRIAGKKLVLSNPMTKDLRITKKDFLKKKYKTLKIPIVDGHVFELGNRALRVIHTKGHTKGSIVILDEQSKIMFTGDNTSPALWMFLPGAVSLERWLRGAAKIFDLAETYTSYSSHMSKPQTKEEIGKLIEMVEEIIKKHPKNKFSTKIEIYPSKEEAMKEGAISVWYRSGNVRRKR